MPQPTCRYCGKEFGNEGAKASHEPTCDEKPRRQPQPGSAGDARPPHQQQAQPPARQPQQQGQPQGGVPATQEQMNPEALQTGAQFGSMLANLSTGNPEEKAEAKGTVLQAVAGTLAQAGQEITQREKQAHQRAKQAAQSDADVRPADNYLECPFDDCDGQITHKPEGNEFPCPDCGRMLELV